MNNLSEKLSNQLSTFSCSEFGSLNVMVIDGKEFFPATQCATILGYAEPAKAVRTHCKGVSKMDTPTNGGVQAVNYIPEGDLYRLIVKSRLPEAERFERWVFDEVLPQLRRTGSYGNIDIEEIIAKTAAAVAAAVVQAIAPVMEQPKKRTNSSPYKYSQPTKIDLLPPALKSKVDEMLASGQYSCQAVANYICNNSGTQISQMAVNRYARNRIWSNIKSGQMSLF